jgi:guanine deaminase
MNTFLRGALLNPTQKGFTFHTDALITVNNGKIIKVEDTPSSCSIPTTHPNCILLPGFTDSHIHFPQTHVCGSASGPLLPWLEKTVFPEESKFNSKEYAQNTADIFCHNLLRYGVCATAAFSSSHSVATDVLFSSLGQSGIKGLAGMTLMNRNAPQELLFDVGYIHDEILRQIETWHGLDNNRLRYCLTPRFAIACDEKMLKLAGDLCEQFSLWVQTHVSENLDEVDFTQQLYPGRDSYLQIYNEFGLLHKRSLMAHCIHFTDMDWELFATSGATVAHCPDSNFFLGSGCMEYNKALSYGTKISIGTDVGAGRTFSMRIATARGYDASLMVNSPVNPEQLLWSATIGGAIHLGFNSLWSENADADIIAIPIESIQTKERVIDAILFQHNKLDVTATYVRGKCLYISN